jgi:hypothetical protein
LLLTPCGFTAQLATPFGQLGKGLYNMLVMICSDAGLMGDDRFTIFIIRLIEEF